jgi:hypothetical protein
MLSDCARRREGVGERGRDLLVHADQRDEAAELVRGDRPRRTMLVHAVISASDDAAPFADVGEGHDDRWFATDAGETTDAAQLSSSSRTEDAATLIATEEAPTEAAGLLT